MNFVLDTHTHTIASGHAYSTINEMIETAKEKKMELLGITEHGPAMKGTCDLIYFMNLKVVPRNYDNLTLMLGAEANIINFEGEIDIPNYVYSGLDYLIASLHGNVIQSGSIQDNTNAVINAMKHTAVKIIGHPDDGNFPLDYDKVVKAASENHVLLEINNSSLKPSSYRVGAHDNYLTMLKKCIEYNVPVSIGSDAHICNDILEFGFVDNLLKEIHFPEGLIMNTSRDKFIDFIK